MSFHILTHVDTCPQGADAVYFGLTLFNARARAANFEAEELGEVMRYLRLRRVKGFVTLNTLIFDEELAAVEDYIHHIATCGVDAVIVQVCHMGSI
jgi:putative protease